MTQNVSDKEDVDILVDYITAKGEGRITLDDNVCKRLVACKNTTYSESLSLISHEIRRFGGNTLTNLYRDARATIPWGSMLDVFFRLATLLVMMRLYVTSLLTLKFLSTSPAPYLQWKTASFAINDTFEDDSPTKDAS